MTLVTRTTVEVTIEIGELMTESDCYRQARDEIYAAYPPPTTLEPIDSEVVNFGGAYLYRWSVL